MPLQPLYRNVRNLAPERVASLLPALSPQRRQLLLDVDLWEKDSLDVTRFEYWIQAYSLCADEDVLLDFVLSPSFHLYMKSRFNIYTFDVEDPQYPEHDHYFLTEDNLLLFEFHPDYPYIHEMKLFLLNLYSRLGVEQAYTTLFKTVSESFSSFQECEYDEKKRRLDEQGFVDYYDSLESESCWPSFEAMDAALAGMGPESAGKLTASREELLLWRDYGSLGEDFERVASDERKQYLEWNFVRLVNAVLSFGGILKKADPDQWGETGAHISSTISLGESYLRERFPEQDVLLERFDFAQVYKVGNTLVRKGRRYLQQIRSRSDVEEVFMGGFWEQFHKESGARPCRFQGKPVADMATWWEWQSWCDGLSRMMPFVESLYKSWKKLLDEGQIHSSFYLNYAVEEIDFEALLISSFANHCLTQSSEPSRRKIGLTREEFRRFIDGVVDEKGKLKNTEDSIRSFLSAYGLDRLPHVQEYFLGRLCAHLEGLDYSDLSPGDYRHLGGPVIFAT